MRNTETDANAVRFSISMEPELLARLDRLAAGGRTRSKVVRDLLRDHLARADLAQAKGGTVGVLTFIYAYDQPDLARRLLEVRHGHHAQVVSSTQVHIDRHDCLEVLILRGPAARVRDLADRVLALHGVRQGRLTLMPARCPLAREHRPREAVE